MPTASEEYELRDTLRRVGIPEEDIAVMARHYERLRDFFSRSSDDANDEEDDE